MPAQSEAMRRLMGIGLSIKEGKTPESYLNEKTKGILNMGKPQLRDFAKGPVVKKPRFRGFKNYKDIMK